MAAATIGALRVVLGADTASFSKGLDQAQSKMRAFGASMARIGAAAAAAFAAAGAGVAYALKGVTDEADKLTKMAQQIGIPVDELSRLKHAADLSGVSIESLGNGVGRLARNMQDASDGLKTPQRAFEQLGINVKNSEGQLKSMSEILPEIADRFSKMEDGTEKTALSMILLGRSGRELIPLLNGGAEGLRSMMKEADELGIVIDQRTGKAAEAFNDNMTRLSRVWDGIITQVAVKMLPFFENLSNMLVGMSKNSDMMSAASDLLTNVLRGLLTVAIGVGGAFKALIDVMQVASLAISLAASSNFAKEAWEPVRQAILGVGDTAKQTADLIRQVWAETAVDVGNSAIKIPERFGAAFDAVKADAADTLKEIKSGLSEVSSVASSLGSGVSSALHSAATGAQTLNDAVKNLLSSLSQMLLNQAFQKLFASAAGSFFDPRNVSFETTVIPAVGKIPGFAQGGLSKVGGSGGIDSQLISLRASPGELIGVSKSGDFGGEANVQVNVINAPAGSKVEERKQGELRVVDVILPVVAKGISEGKFDGAMGQRYGARPAAARR